MKGIADAIYYCHQKGIIHRDLKPSNVMLDEIGRVKVVDFGISGICKNNRSDQIDYGTTRYMAPEQHKGDMRSNPATDVWALGVIFYILLFNAYPHNGTDLEKSIVENNYRLPEEKRPESETWISQECEALLRGML